MLPGKISLWVVKVQGSTTWRLGRNPLYRIFWYVRTLSNGKNKIWTPWAELLGCLDWEYASKQNKYKPTLYLGIKWINSIFYRSQQHLSAFEREYIREWNKIFFILWTMLGTLTNCNPSLGISSGVPGDLYHGIMLDVYPGFTVAKCILDPLA